MHVTIKDPLKQGLAAKAVGQLFGDNTDAGPLMPLPDKLKQILGDPSFDQPRWVGLRATKEPNLARFALRHIGDFNQMKMALIHRMEIREQGELIGYAARTDAQGLIDIRNWARGQ